MLHKIFFFTVFFIGSFACLLKAEERGNEVYPNTSSNSQQQTNKKSSNPSSNATTSTKVKSNKPPINNNTKKLSAQEQLKQDVDFKAKRIYYDFTNNIATATGEVTFKSGTRELHADQISYSSKTDVLYAKGNVTLIDEQGNKIHAKEIILDSEIQKGFITDFKTVFADKSQLIAKSVERKNNISYNLQNMCYTSCRVTPNSLPTWSVNAKSGIYDEEDSKIVLHNVWFDVYNIPVFWTPYFTFSNLALDRKAGFLIPQLSSNSTYGGYLEQPFYMPFGTHQDAVLTTDLFFNHSPLYLLNYKGFIENGNFNIHAGYVKDTPENAEWHLFGEINKDLSKIWRISGKIEQVSDPKYLKLYDIDDKDDEESFFEDHVILEGFFNQNNYLSLSWEHYDNANKDFDNIKNTNPNFFANDTTTSINYDYYGDYTRFGRLNINAEGNNFYAEDPASSIYRLGLKVSYQYVKPTNFGNYSVDVLSQSVAYQDGLGSHDSDIEDNFASQLAAAATWDYSWIYNKGNFVYSFGPIAQALVSDVLNDNTNDILFDSYNETVTASNLFDINHYSGFDNFTNNNSIKYALQGSILNSDDLGSRLFIGQMFTYGNSNNMDSSYDTNNEFAKSNYFVSWYLYPLKSTYIAYDGILTPNFEIEESSLSIGYRNTLFAVGGTYYMYNNLDPTIYREAQQSELNNYIRISLNNKLDLVADTVFDTTNSNAELKEINFTLTWTNECVQVEFYIDRDIYEDSSNSYGIKLYIRGLDNYNFGL